jgi:hypothetical protein
MGRFAPRPRHRLPRTSIAGHHATKEAVDSATSARAPFRADTAADAPLSLDRPEQCCGVWRPTFVEKGSASCSSTSTLRAQQRQRRRSPAPPARQSALPWPPTSGRRKSWKPRSGPLYCGAKELPVVVAHRGTRLFHSADVEGRSGDRGTAKPVAGIAEIGASSKGCSPYSNRRRGSGNCGNPDGG